MGNGLVKLVLTQQASGGGSYTYDNDSTTNRIIVLKQPEKEWSQAATVLIDNRDNNLTALALEGYSGVISWGFNDPTAGDEYSATAPLEVFSQKADTILRQPQSDLLVTLTLKGLFDMWDDDRASVAYEPSSTSTDTVKTILDAIAGATMACFSHCKAHTITYDSGYATNTKINTYKPADYFQVGFNESRLSAFKRALSYVKNRCVVKNDAGVATIHIVDPTISGSTYSYEYNDSVTEHNFFDKSVRQRLVVPTKEIVSSHPDHATSYTGSATDTASETALNRSLPNHRYLRVTSNDECTALATAFLQETQMAADKGQGTAPMNCGQEVFDYINITDSVAVDTRAGNISYLERQYAQGKFEFVFAFGDLILSTMPILGMGIDPRVSVLVGHVNTLFGAYNGLNDKLLDLTKVVEWLEKRNTVDYWHITKTAIAPVE